MNIPSLFLLGYHWLPLATIDLVGDNREFKVYFTLLDPLWVVDSLKTLNIHHYKLVLGYHWLLLPTIDLMGDNKEFEVSDIFWTFRSIMGG